jgi:uncharacterized protein with GYD domain
MFVMVADAGGAFCHLVHRPDAFKAAQHRKFNELPALWRAGARAIVAGMVCARQQRPHKFETAQSFKHPTSANGVPKAERPFKRRGSRVPWPGRPLSAILKQKTWAEACRLLGQNAKYSSRADVFRLAFRTRHCSTRSALGIGANAGRAAPWEHDETDEKWKCEPPSAEMISGFTCNPPGVGCSFVTGSRLALTVGQFSRFWLRAQEDFSMPRFLSLFKYSQEGARGFLKEKAAGREVAAKKAIESVGGKLETFYWTGSGEYTGMAISDLPDAASGAAFVALVGASGAFAEFKTIELLTGSEVDRALGKSMVYRPPGS